MARKYSGVLLVRQLLANPNNLLLPYHNLPSNSNRTLTSFAKTQFSPGSTPSNSKPLSNFSTLRFLQNRPHSSFPGPEPNNTIKKIRSDAVLRPTGKQQGRIYFGQNLVCKDSLTGRAKGNVVKVGDVVNVLKMVSSADEAAA